MTTPFRSEDEAPPAVIDTLPDGSVRITVGDLAGTVSSSHLIEPKVAQLRAAWCRDRS